MPRNIYAAEHEDFRSSVQEFVDRTLAPRTEQMLEAKSIIVATGSAPSTPWGCARTCTRGPRTPG